MLIVGVIASVLTWLNGSPWWGWAAVVAALLVAGFAAMHWAQRRALVRIGAWMLTAVLVGAVAIFVHPVAQTRPATQANAPTTEAVDTEQGPVTGVYNEQKSVEVFAGIPYAQPPVGDLRWAAPQAPKKRTAVLAADRFSAVPVQTASSFPIRALSRFVDLPLKDTFLNPFPVAEDSLYLNVWRSSSLPTSGGAPVLVYIPGGGFSSGSGALPVYDGAALAARGDIITVTINYRLGVLGFLADSNLSAETDSATSGNYGILDQVAALQWVRDNIASFGGDPNRVTVAGESAGGESTCILGATPLAKGLLHGIIGESGACLGTAGDTERGDQMDTKDVAESAGAELRETLHGATIAEMRAMPASRIVEAASSLSAHWRPSVDGYVLPKSTREIYEGGEQLDVPTLLGSNEDEASLLLASPPDTDPDAYSAEMKSTYGATAEAFLKLYPGNTNEEVLSSRLQAQTDQTMTAAMYRWAQLQGVKAGHPTYLYYFTRTPPDANLKKFGAYHGSEVMYAYDNLGSDDNAKYTTADYRLRDRMSGYWVNFVTKGDPNGTGLPTWPTVQDQPNDVMNFDVDTAVIPRPSAAAVDFWMTYGGPTP